MQLTGEKRLPRGLVVSCQALEGEPLHGPHFMAAMAKAAVMGGAVALRVNGPEDIRAVRQSVQVPIIGLYKAKIEGFDVFITPTFEHARMVKEAGADVVALDATKRGRPDGLSLPQTIARIHEELGIEVMADVSTLKEGVAASQAGADYVATTLSGYTPYSRQSQDPDLALVRQLAEAVNTPVVAEGRFWTPREVMDAIRQGAYGIVVGTAITRPQEITKRFAKAAVRAMKTSC